MVQETPGRARKSLFVTLRYLYIVTASCLLFMQVPVRGVDPIQIVMVLVALASNVGLCFVSPLTLFAWYVEAPVLIADTLWVSWALHSTGAIGSEFFLLYFFVLFLATIGENLMVVLAGSTMISAANVYLVWDSTAHALLAFRVVFFYFVALFYGHVLGQIRQERQRADKGLAWARELEAKVAERTAELQRMYDESMAANRVKSEFVNNMSHELRTPLNIVIGYADIMLDETRDPNPLERREMTRRVRDAAARLLDLVDSVLDLGKLESGRVPVHNEPVALDRLMADVRRRERVKVKEGVALSWQIASTLPVIETDPAKLGIVLDNLVNNAIKFTARGAVIVSARDMPEAQQVEFRVDDTGPGIPEEQLSRIFEPFTQLGTACAPEAGGVGLGLAIVQRHLALLGASIAVNSIPGSGTSFRVMLPYRPTRVDAVARAA
jgi:signal transduction histidine kinase